MSGESCLVSSFMFDALKSSGVVLGCPVARIRVYTFCFTPSLLGHFEEEEEGELFDVVSVGETVVAEDVAVVPAFVD